MPEDRITRLNAALEGRYRIVRELGEGGMATVYLAADARHERKVAVKVLRPELAAVIGGERFISEIKTTASLQHPHILPLFDSGEADGFLYYVMPYVEGESLRAKLDRERQLDVDEAVHIAKAVASALHYAHERGVIHRDIKPENVLLHAGEPVVADFGIALAISAAGGGRLTETGLSLGTPHYMSPEQAAADRDLTARSDIYALACVLYEMLAGQPPHTGPTAQSILVRILTEEARAVTELRPTVPSHVAAVAAKGLEKLPADRFKSAEEMRAALDNASFRYSPAGRGAGAAAAASGAGGRRGVSGGRRTAALGATTAVLALTTAWLAWGDRGPETPSLGAPVVSFVAVDSVVGVPPVAVGPDGTVVYERNFQLWVRPPGALESTRLLDVDVGTYFAGLFDISPDGAWVVFSEPRQGDAESLLRRVPVSGGPVTTLSSRGGQEPFLLAPRWGDDGWIYYSTGEGMPSELHRVPSAGGVADTLLDLDGRPALPSDVLPGGRGLLYTVLDSLEGDGRVMVLDLASRDTTELVADGFMARWSPTGHLVYAHGSGALWAAPFDLADLRVTGPPVPVLDGLGTSLTFASWALSRTGTLAYVTGEGSEVGADGWVFSLVDEAGNRETLPIGTDFPVARLSPDGRSVAYVRSQDIWIFELDRGSNGPLTEGRSGAGFPAWSPDGSRVAYGWGDRGVSVRVADRSAEPEELPGSEAGDAPNDWLDDGTLIVTRGWQGGNPDLVALNADRGGAGRPLLEADWLERGGRISPDGRWLAYVSARSGAPRVYVRSWPDLEAETLVSEDGLDPVPTFYPLWSPDGGTLYYMRDQRVVAAEVRTDRAFEVVERRILPVTVSGYLQDIHPDGRLLLAEFAAVRSGEAAARQLVVVTNWLTELRERLGGG